MVKETHWFDVGVNDPIGMEETNSFNDLLNLFATMSEYQIQMWIGLTRSKRPSSPIRFLSLPRYFLRSPFGM